MSSKRQGSNSRSPRRSVAVPELEGVQALVVNLDRRPDRWERCEKMLKEETPWLKYERFSASDGSQMTIPENEVCVHWNTKCNAKYGDYDEWVFDAPDNKDLDGVHWKWPDAVNEADNEWSFTADDDASAKATVVKGLTSARHLHLVSWSLVWFSECQEVSVAVRIHTGVFGKLLHVEQRQL